LKQFKHQNLLFHRSYRTTARSWPFVPHSFCLKIVQLCAVSFQLQKNGEFWQRHLSHLTPLQTLVFPLPIAIELSDWDFFGIRSVGCHHTGPALSNVLNLMHSIELFPKVLHFVLLSTSYSLSAIQIFALRYLFQKISVGLLFFKEMEICFGSQNLLQENYWNKV